VAVRRSSIYLAVRVSIEVLGLSKHFGLKHQHFTCLLSLGATLAGLEKSEEAEIFVRDALEFARDELLKTKELMAAGVL
jgi:hypothetical protein